LEFLRATKPQSYEREEAREWQKHKTFQNVCENEFVAGKFTRSKFIARQRSVPQNKAFINWICLNFVFPKNRTLEFGNILSYLLDAFDVLIKFWL
jgi:hypothetical protein